MSCRYAFSAGLILFWLFSFSTLALAQNREQIVKEFDLLWEQIKAKEPALLAVSEEDRAANAEFLAQRDTGIIRLLPRERYDGKLRIRGGGAYYSFVRLTHEYGYGSDISGGFTYRSRLPATVGTTYALRSIGYDTSDILVAFHLLRRDEDGSFVLLWKKLATFPTPILIREN